MSKIRSTIQDEKYRVPAVAILVGICCLLTYYFHWVLGVEVVFSHFFYIPIILAAVWWKRKGLGVAIFLALWLLASYSLSHLGLDWDFVNNLARAALFIIVGTTVSILSERMARTEDRLREHAENLERMVEERTKEIKKFSDAVEASTESIVISDLEAKITDVNEATLKMYGTGNKEDLVGKSSFDLIAPEDQQKAVAGMEEALEKGYAKDRGYLITKDGSKLPVEMSVTIMKGVDGEPIGFVGITTDITERVRAEETLQTERAQLLSLFDSIDEIIYVTDMDTHEILYANKALQKAFQKPLIGEICYKEFQGLDQPCEFCTNPIIKTLNYQPYHWEYYNPLLNADFIITDRVIEWPDGRDVRFEIALDITERKRAEETLRESEQTYKALINTTSTGYLIINSQGQVVDANAEYVRLSGHETLQEILGRSVVEWTAPHDQQRNAAEVEKCAKAGMVRNLEIDYIGKNGVITPIEINATVVQTEKGTMILSLCRDITARKRAEKVREITYRISQAAVSTESLEELYHSIHSVLSELMPVENFFIALYDPVNDLLSFPYFVDQYDQPPLPKKPARGLSEYVLCTGQPLLAPPEVFDHLLQQGEVELVGTNSVDWLGVPLKVKDHVIGVMVTQSYTEGIRFSQEDADLLGFVSTQAAQAIESKRAEEKIHQQLEELRRWQSVMLGREDRIQELKREVNELLKNLNLPSRYGKF